jgi:hypothetical protein
MVVPLPVPSRDPAGGARHLLDALLADPPVVHTMGRPDLLGVWATDRDCYEMIISSVRPGDLTLETGAGLSTLLFAAAGAAHTVVTPIDAERDRLVEAAARLGVDLGNVRFILAPSDDALPTLDPGPLSLVLIDGAHGFPAPILDWYYAGRHLRAGGLLIVDDIPLPAPATLLAFLESDPAWLRVKGTDKWAAFRRQGDGTLLVEHHQQPWHESGRAADLGTRRLSTLLAHALVRSARRRLASR